MDPKAIQLGARRVGDVIMRNSPTILTGLSVAGLVTTVVMAVNATPKAMQLIGEGEEQRRIEYQDWHGTSEDDGTVKEELTKMEKVKLSWKCYIPTAIMGAVTIAMIIGANSINLRRNAALASLYSLTEATLQEYQRKVFETLGEKKEERIRDEISQDRLNSHPVDDKQVIITGNGDVLCFDSLSGRYFKSSMEAIKKAQNDFNYRLLNDMYRPLNEFYDLIGLEPTSTGDDMGWATDFGLLDIRFSTKVATNEQPCLVLEYKVFPRQMG